MPAKSSRAAKRSAAPTTSRAVTPTQPQHFATPRALRDWFEKHHATRDELWVAYYKRGTGKASITWPESVDEALCFGWIDGVRKSLDDERYTIRFTPRRARSIWSNVNTRRMQTLLAEGRVHERGRAAFAARREDRTGIYSTEQRDHVPSAELETMLRKDPRAWAFWMKQTPSYRRIASHWTTSAKKEETRARRLATLLADCSAGRTIKPLTAPGTKR